MGLMDIVPAGVVTGDNLMKLMEHCRDNQVRAFDLFSEPGSVKQAQDSARVIEG